MRVYYILSLSLALTHLNAATLIQTRDDQNEVTELYIQGQQARISMPDNEGYVLMDASRNTMKLIVHPQRSVLDMSSLTQHSGNTPAESNRVKTSTRKLGKGPRIAGYDTVEYGLYAGKQYCGSVFISEKVMQDLKLKSLAQSMMQMQDNLEMHMSQLTGMSPGMFNDPCEAAELAGDKQLMTLGFPLKSIDRDKQVTSLVTHIDRQAKLPANAFAIPAGYTQTTPEQMAQQSTQEMQPQMMQMQQEMERAMKDMPPEMRQMLQQQMQQFQQ